MSDSYTVTIKGKGVNLEREVDEPLAQRLIIAVFTGKADTIPADVRKPADQHQAGTPGASQLEEHADSLSNYLAAAEAKKVPQKIAAIGFFLKKYRNAQTFNKEALEQGFEDAADSVPKNLSRDLKDTVRAGWIAAKAGAKGEFYVTGAGAQAVTSHFTGTSKRLRRQGKQKRKSKESAKA